MVSEVAFGFGKSTVASTLPPAGFRRQVGELRERVREEVRDREPHPKIYWQYLGSELHSFSFPTIPCPLSISSSACSFVTCNSLSQLKRFGGSQIKW